MRVWQLGDRRKLRNILRDRVQFVQHEPQREDSQFWTNSWVQRDSSKSADYLEEPRGHAPLLSEAKPVTASRPIYRPLPPSESNGAGILR